MNAMFNNRLHWMICMFMYHGILSLSTPNIVRSLEMAHEMSETILVQLWLELKAKIRQNKGFFVST